MAEDISCLMGVTKGGESTSPSSSSSSPSSEKSTAPVTRDLLSRCCNLESKELDLDFHAPFGWEKRLDLKSGKVYLQRRGSSILCSSTLDNKPNCANIAKPQNLDPPWTSKRSMDLFCDSSLDLKLVTSSSTTMPSSIYQNICTLDKVKNALENETMRKRSLSAMRTSSPLSNSSSSVKDCDIEDKRDASFATGCPNCLLYVLISKSNPRCPNCKAIVPSPADEVKKPQIDLNMSV